MGPCKERQGHVRRAWSEPAEGPPGPGFSQLWTPRSDVASFRVRCRINFRGLHGHEWHTGWLQQSCRPGRWEEGVGRTVRLWTLQGRVCASPAAGASAASLRVITWPSLSLLAMPPVPGPRAQPHPVRPSLSLIPSGTRISTRGPLPSSWGLGPQPLFLGSTARPTAQHVHPPRAGSSSSPASSRVRSRRKRKSVSLDNTGRTRPVALCSYYARAWVVTVARRRDPSLPGWTTLAKTGGETGFSGENQKSLPKMLDNQAVSIHQR